MKSCPCLSNVMLLIAIVALFLPAVTTAASVALGDAVKLRGSAPGADSVFLFLTGPNLPANGVKLTDISSAVINGNPSSFTRVDVDPDGTWLYTWYTRGSGVLPDAGAYTVWAVYRPSGRLDLAGADYSTITVSGTPDRLTAGTSTGEPGSAGGDTGAGTYYGIPGVESPAATITMVNNASVPATTAAVTTAGSPDTGTPGTAQPAAGSTGQAATPFPLAGIPAGIGAAAYMVRNRIRPA
jgi:hypothetical protein